MKLSILDQAPISDHMTEQDALHASIKLAKRGEKLGYERYWISEHHDLYGLACPNPSVMIAAIGAQTSTIQLGAGAVLLPHYKPFHVAETYNLLATLFPNRIDLGLGRAPGGSAEVSMALAGNFLEQVRQFPDDIDELQSFLTSSFPADHMYSKVTPTPTPPTSPHVWMLGTSEKSALLAVEKKLDYVFGHFMTSVDGPAVVSTYRAGMGDDGHAIVAIHVICAETSEEADDLALSYFLWNIKRDQMDEDVRVPSVAEAKAYDWTEEDQAKVEKMKRNMLIGSPADVRTGMLELKEQYKAEEFMIITIVHEVAAKLRSYELVKEVLNG